MYKISKIAASAGPFIIIGGLLYAGFFVKPSPIGGSVLPAIFARGDAFYGFASPTEPTLWVAGTAGKIVRSDDGGKSWSLQNTPTDVALQDIAAWDSNRAVAVGNHGVVIFTADGGKSWQRATAPTSRVANKLMRVRALDGGIGWAVGEFGALLRSADFGATWVRVGDEEDMAWNDVAFRGNLGWLVGEFGRLKRSEDSGRTWRQVPTGVEKSLMAVAFKDPTHGVAVGLTGTIIVTDDAGQTWSEVKSPVHEHLFDVAWTGTAWTAIGAKGFVLTAVDPKGQWSAGPISQTDRSWHTRVGVLRDGLLLTGETVVAIRKNNVKALSR